MHSVFDILEEDSDSAGPDLIALADLKLALGITDSSEDAALAAQITFQSRLIAEYCDRRFGRAEALETFTFDPGEVMHTRNALVLTLYPIVEIHEPSDAEYTFDPASGRVWTTGNWAGTVEIAYAGGYDLPEEAPARLAKAVIESISETRTVGSRDPGLRSVQHGDTQVSYWSPAVATASPGFLSAVVIDLIKPYRRLSVA